MKSLGVWLVCIVSSLTVRAFPSQMNELRDMLERFPSLLEELQANAPSDENIPPLVADNSWPSESVKLGQVSGVDVCKKHGDVYIFHRADREWTQSSFDQNHQYLEKDQGAIPEYTIQRLSKETGEIVESKGDEQFYLPHGLTVDGEGNLWLTDVAMHQVFKIPADSHDPSLTLGEPFVPGSDETHFCKPTDVAVASSGVFFVADGYCNQRIMKFSPNGTMMSEWGSDGSSPNYSLLVPHSLTLMEADDAICVADREHGRVQCYHAGLQDPAVTGEFMGTIEQEDFGKVYAIAYDSNADVMYAINGEDRHTRRPVQGFTMDPRNGQMLETWAPPQGFDVPHDIAVSPDGADVYVAEIGQRRVWKFSREVEEEEGENEGEEENAGEDTLEEHVDDEPIEAELGRVKMAM